MDTINFAETLTCSVEGDITSVEDKYVGVGSLDVFSACFVVSTEEIAFSFVVVRFCSVVKA